MHRWSGLAAEGGTMRSSLHGNERRRSTQASCSAGCRAGCSPTLKQPSKFKTQRPVRGTPLSRRFDPKAAFRHARFAAARFPPFGSARRTGSLLAARAVAPNLEVGVTVGSWLRPRTTELPESGQLAKRTSDSTHTTDCSLACRAEFSAVGLVRVVESETVKDQVLLRSRFSAPPASPSILAREPAIAIPKSR